MWHLTFYLVLFTIASCLSVKSAQLECKLISYIKLVHSSSTVLSITVLNRHSHWWMGVPAVPEWDQQHVGSAGTQVQSPAQDSELRIWHCCSYGLGHNCSLYLIPGGRGGSGQKKKKERGNEWASEWASLLYYVLHNLPTLKSRQYLTQVGDLDPFDSIFIQTHLPVYCLSGLLVKS